MDYTDRHFRHLFRLLTNRTLVYSEMVAANAIAHEYRTNDKVDNWQMRRYLSQSLQENPSVLQLGGSDTEQVRQAARAVMEMTREGYCDYTALNLNCGCPSPKVANKGAFGASLMENPDLVKRLCRNMWEGCSTELPVTVKCRIGTDSTTESELYSNLKRFIETIADDGIVSDFQVHARIAVLNKKFSPAQNRNIPPLKHDFVTRLVRDFPELSFSLNGGVETLNQAREHLDACPGLAGVMVGRSMIASPWNWAMSDQLIYKEKDGCDKQRWNILRAYGNHADREESLWGTKIRRMIVKAVTGLFAGEPNAKKWRIGLDQIAALPKKYAEKGLLDPTPLSEHILTLASTCFTSEILERTAEESYQIILDQESKGDASKVISDWHNARIRTHPSSTEKLAHDDVELSGKKESNQQSDETQIDEDKRYAEEASFKSLG